jgi:hypothetical protein
VPLWGKACVKAPTAETVKPATGHPRDSKEIAGGASCLAVATQGGETPGLASVMWLTFHMAAIVGSDGIRS